MNSSQPIICVPKQTHRVFHRTHRVYRRTQSVLSCETVLSKQYSARLLKQPKERVSGRISRGRPGVICADVSVKRRRHIKLRKIIGTPAGCPWDTRRDKQGSTGRCPRNFLLFTKEKMTEKGLFAGTPAGCRWDTRPSRGLSEILCDFVLCAFSAP